jgi:malate/lactate dehydrogenase
MKSGSEVISRKGGAEQHLELKLWPKEEQALKASAKALQDMLAKVAG